MTRLRRVVAAAVTVVGLLATGTVLAPSASAHPLGNFTVNVYSDIQVAPSAVSVDVVVDSAEIPTLQALPQARQGLSAAESAAYRDAKCADVLAGSQLRLDGEAVPLHVVGSTLQFPPGEAGLPTSRLTCGLRGSASTVGTTVTFASAVEGDRIGWREITVGGDGTRLAGASVPAESLSLALTAYPEDLLSSPLDQRSATARVVGVTGDAAGAAVAAPGAPADSVNQGVDRLTGAYTTLVASNDLTFGFGLLAVLLAVLLGGLHAFAPGHGKALMAASLVGRHGSLGNAAVIGLSVTVTHTAGVLVLGLALTATSLAAPERVYPWLGLISGLLLVGIGVTLLRNALQRQPISAPARVAAALGAVGAPGQDHAHGQAHDHARPRPRPRPRRPPAPAPAR